MQSERCPGFEPSVDLRGGARMPLLGCGTQYGFAGDGNARGSLADGAQHLARALRAGFRLLDTARSYGSESCVLEALAAADVPRRDVFIVSKAWVGADHPIGLDASRAAVAESAQRLGGYVDLFLVHQPVPGWQDLWRTLEDAREQGLVRAIGVSNFGVEQLQELARFACHEPAANQIHLHPFVYEDQRATIAWCEAHGVRVLAYPRCPWRLGPGSVVDAVAAECGRTRAQVMLRWAIEHGFAVVPLSTDDAHLAENFAVRGFRLRPDQVARIDRIADRPRLRFHVDRADDVGLDGWAFVQGGHLRVHVLVNDQTLGEATVGGHRPDVAAAHPHAPEALASGFTFRFPARCFAAGPREVCLRFETPNGETTSTTPLHVAPRAGA